VRIDHEHEHLWAGLLNLSQITLVAGPEPTTDKFIAVVHGKEKKVIKGNSLTVVPELPFGGLANFGAAFLNKVRTWRTM
jgi:hypothetical protein